jgi:hypothetical protein
LASEKAAIEIAMDARRPNRSLIQPNSSPPTPVIPTPTAVSVARFPSDRLKASWMGWSRNDRSISE